MGRLEPRQCGAGVFPSGGRLGTRHETSGSLRTKAVDQGMTRLQSRQHPWRNDFNRATAYHGAAPGFFCRRVLWRSRIVGRRVQPIRSQPRCSFSPPPAHHRRRSAPREPGGCLVRGHAGWAAVSGRAGLAGLAGPSLQGRRRADARGAGSRGRRLSQRKRSRVHRHIFRRRLDNELTDPGLALQ
jgi:hypothetical protein